MQGVSMVPFVEGKTETVRPDYFAFGWEVFGHSAICKGDWKLLKIASVSGEVNQTDNQDADYW